MFWFFLTGRRGFPTPGPPWDIFRQAKGLERGFQRGCGTIKAGEGLGDLGS